MPVAKKLPEGKGIFQVITQKLEKGKMEILFQMEIDNKGNTTITVFKGERTIPVEAKDDTDKENGVS